MENEAQSLWRSYRRDYYGGILMVLIGLGALEQGLDYEVGTFTHMGSGFFPVSLGAILVLLGIAIAIGARKVSPVETTAFREIREDSKFGWRGPIAISSSIVAFVVLAQYCGLLPATFAIVFISALGDRKNTVMGSLALATAISIVSVVIFWWALQLQLPLFKWG